MTRRALLLVCACLAPRPAAAQAVEAFGGARRATLDVMLFRPLALPATSAPAPGAPRTRSNALFFFRARASTGYDGADTLPQFGLTTAVSYGRPGWRGFAPVGVGQVFNRGVVPKAGVQFAHVDPQLTIFTWLVCETLRRPVVDYFLLVRYAYPITGLWGLFVQAESVSTLPTSATEPFGFYERARLGIQLDRWQLGPGLDVSHVGRGTFTHAFNLGGFARHDF